MGDAIHAGRKVMDGGLGVGVNLRLDEGGRRAAPSCLVRAYLDLSIRNGGVW